MSGSGRVIFNKPLENKLCKNNLLPSVVGKKKIIIPEGLKSKELIVKFIVGNILLPPFGKLVVEYIYDDILLEQRECILNKIYPEGSEDIDEIFYTIPEEFLLTMKQAREIGNKNSDPIYILEPQMYSEFSILDSNSDMFEDRSEDSDIQIGWFHDEDGLAVSGSGSDIWIVFSTKLYKFLCGNN